MQKQAASKTAPTDVPMAAAAPLPQAPSCKISLNKAIEDFLKQYEPTVSYQTFKGEKTNTNNISRIMGNQLVGDITFDDFQKLVNTVSQGKNGNRAAPKTVRNHIISFKRIWHKTGVRQHPTSPCKTKEWQGFRHWHDKK